jgi:putative peptidoglycan lipid II flippase
MKEAPSGRLAPESIRKGVLYSIAMSLGSKGLSFLVQVSVVACFGAKGTTDVFFWCLSLIFSLTGLIGSVDSIVVVPHGIHLLNREGKASMQGFLAAMGKGYLAVSLLVTAFLVSFPAEIAGLLSKFDGQTLDSNVTLIRLTLLSLPASVGATLISDIFAIHKIFSVPIFVEAIRGATTLAVFLGLQSRMGGASAGWAFLTGSLIQLALLGVLLKAKLEWPRGGSLRYLSGEVARDIGYALLGQSAFFIYVTYTAYIMSGFQAGIFSSMNCAQSLSNPIQLIFLTKISYVVGIYFMDLYSQGKLRELNDLFQSSLKTVLLGLLVLIPLMALFSDPLVRLVFLRGKFQAADAALTAQFFRLFVLCLPLILIDNFVTQLIFASKKVGSSVYLQLGTSLANVLAITLLVGRWGYFGYPLGLLTVRVLYLFVQWAFVRRHFTFLDAAAVPLFLGRNVLTLLILGTAVWPLRRASGHLFEVLLTTAIFIGPLVWKDNRLIVARLWDQARRKFSGG